MKSALRISILVILSCIAFVGLFSGFDEGAQIWTAKFILIKLSAIAVSVITGGLYRHWVRIDKVISNYNKWCYKTDRTRF